MSMGRSETSGLARYRANARERIVLVLSGFEIDADSCEEIADAVMAALQAPTEPPDRGQNAT